MELEQYRAIRRGAGLLSRTSRGLIAVRGNDRSDYLQGLLTNDIAAVSVGAGCYAAYLTPQGRLELDLEVFNLGDWILLDVDAGVKQTLITRLENLVFTEDVSVVDMSERWISYGLHGPATLDVVEAAFSSLGASSGTLSARWTGDPYHRPNGRTRCVWCFNSHHPGRVNSNIRSVDGCWKYSH